MAVLSPKLISDESEESHSLNEVLFFFLSEKVSAIVFTFWNAFL